MVQRIAVVAAAAALLAGCPPSTRTAETPATVAVDAAPPPPEAAPSRAEVYKERLESQLGPYIDAMGARWGEAFAFSGLVHVAVGGETIYSLSRGFRDRARRQPIDADTSFRIASVTKQFTAAAILALAERGALSTSDTVRKHLPDYPKSGDKITVHQLLTHTAGVPSDGLMRAVLETPSRRRSIAELVALFSGSPLDFEPGSAFKYSNAGYILLGAIIEKVAQKPYGAFVAETLFAPARLAATAFGDQPDRVNRALGYTVDDTEALVAAPPIDMSNPLSAGGVRSTASDLVAWDRALAKDAILGAEARRRLVTPEKDGYAYGWRVGSWDGKRRIEHNGEITGFNCVYIRVPEDQLVVVIWTNNDALQVRPIAEAAMRALAGESVSPPVETEAAPLEEVNARRVVGGYVLTAESRGALAAIGLDAAVIDSMAAVFIRREGDHLYFDPIGADRVLIHAEPADADGFQTRFFAKIGHLELEVSYAIDDEGRRVSGAASTLVAKEQGIEVKLARDDRAAARLESAWRRKRPKSGTTKGKATRRRHR